MNDAETIIDKLSFLKQQLFAISPNSLDLLGNASVDFSWAHPWAALPWRDGWAGQSEVASPACAGCQPGYFHSLCGLSPFCRLEQPPEMSLRTAFQKVKGRSRKTY